jgi:hypothetical protein
MTTLQIDNSLWRVLRHLHKARRAARVLGVPEGSLTIEELDSAIRILRKRMALPDRELLQ